MILEAVVALVLLAYIAILVHEFGHYLAYRKYGVPVEGFYIGGPPWVVRWKRGKTEYRLGLVPLFGAVATRWEEVDGLPPGKILGLFLAGPLFSLGAAISGFVALGLAKGSTLLTLKLLAATLTFPVILLRDLYHALFLDLPTAGAIPLVQATEGIIGNYGPVSLFALWGALNAVLFWFNLLPFPPLDGGQALFLLYRHRPWFDRVYPYVLGVGLALMFALMEVAVIKDLMRVLGR